MMALAVSTCDDCGQTDDHPKHHYGAETYHHDCTPHRVIEDMTSVSVWGRDADNQLVLVSRTPLSEDLYDEHTKRFLHARQLALKGTRGDKLRAHLLALPAHDEAAPVAVAFGAAPVPKRSRKGN